MIDLGDELADYGEQPQTPSKPPEGMGSFGRLADLQAGGFDVDPRRADVDPQQWSFTAPGSFTIDTGPLVNNPCITRIVGGAAGITPGGAGGGGRSASWITPGGAGGGGRSASWIMPGGAGGGFDPTSSISEDDPE